MNEKKILIVCGDIILAEILESFFRRLTYKAEVVDHPKQAVAKIENDIYSVVLIDRNKGTIVKQKLAEILYLKALSKPHIIIFREPGEIIADEHYITVILRPTFHQDLIKNLERMGFASVDTQKDVQLDLSSFIENPFYEKSTIMNFFRSLKGNKKFIIKRESNRIIGFIMGADLYILHSDLKNPYDILGLETVEVAIEPLTLSEFLSLPIYNSTFKTNMRDFLGEAISQINDADKLLNFLPGIDFVIRFKAPAFIIRQVNIVSQNLNINDALIKNNHLTVGEITNNASDLGKVKAVVCMYLLNMIELEEKSVTKKYDVKIKKSFLKKIIDKIRGL